MVVPSPPQDCSLEGPGSAVRRSASGVPRLESHQQQSPASDNGHTDHSPQSGRHRRSASGVPGLEGHQADSPQSDGGHVDHGLPPSRHRRSAFGARGLGQFPSSFIEGGNPLVAPGRHRRSVSGVPEVGRLGGSPAGAGGAGVPHSSFAQGRYGRSLSGVPDPVSAPGAQGLKATGGVPQGQGFPRNLHTRSNSDTGALTLGSTYMLTALSLEHSVEAGAKLGLQYQGQGGGRAGHGAHFAVGNASPGWHTPDPGKLGLCQAPQGGTFLQRVTSGPSRRGPSPSSLAALDPLEGLCGSNRGRPGSAPRADRHPGAAYQRGPEALPACHSSSHSALGVNGSSGRNHAGMTGESIAWGTVVPHSFGGVPPGVPKVRHPSPNQAPSGPACLVPLSAPVLGGMAKQSSLPADAFAALLPGWGDPLHGLQASAALVHHRPSSSGGKQNCGSQGAPTDLEPGSSPDQMQRHLLDLPRKHGTKASEEAALSTEAGFGESSSLLALLQEARSRTGPRARPNSFVPAWDSRSCGRTAEAGSSSDSVGAAGRGSPAGTRHQYPALQPSLSCDKSPLQGDTAGLPLENSLAKALLVTESQHEAKGGSPSTGSTLIIDVDALVTQPSTGLSLGTPPVPGSFLPPSSASAGPLPPPCQRWGPPSGSSPSSSCSSNPNSRSSSPARPPQPRPKVPRPGPGRSLLGGGGGSLHPSPCNSQKMDGARDPLAQGECPRELHVASCDGLLTLPLASEEETPGGALPGSHSTGATVQSHQSGQVQPRGMGHRSLSQPESRGPAHAPPRPLHPLPGWQAAPGSQGDPHVEPPKGARGQSAVVHPWQAPSLGIPWSSSASCGTGSDHGTGFGVPGPQPHHPQLARAASATCASLDGGAAPGNVADWQTLPFQPGAPSAYQGQCNIGTSAHPPAAQEWRKAVRRTFTLRVVEQQGQIVGWSQCGAQGASGVHHGVPGASAQSEASWVLPDKVGRHSGGVAQSHSQMEMGNAAGSISGRFPGSGASPAGSGASPAGSGASSAGEVHFLGRHGAPPRPSTMSYQQRILQRMESEPGPQASQSTQQRQPGGTPEASPAAVHKPAAPAGLPRSQSQSERVGSSSPAGGGQSPAASLHLPRGQLWKRAHSVTEKDIKSFFSSTTTHTATPAPTPSQGLTLMPGGASPAVPSGPTAGPATVGPTEASLVAVTGGPNGGRTRGRAGGAAVGVPGGARCAEEAGAGALDTDAARLQTDPERLGPERGQKCYKTSSACVGVSSAPLAPVARASGVGKQRSFSLTDQEIGVFFGDQASLQGQGKSSSQATQKHEEPDLVASAEDQGGRTSRNKASSDMTTVCQLEHEQDIVPAGTQGLPTTQESAGEASSGEIRLPSARAWRRSHSVTEDDIQEFYASGGSRSMSRSGSAASIRSSPQVQWSPAAHPQLVDSSPAAHWQHPQAQGSPAIVTCRPQAHGVPTVPHQQPQAPSSATRGQAAPRTQDADKHYSTAAQAADCALTPQRTRGVPIGNPPEPPVPSLFARQLTEPRNRRGGTPDRDRDADWALTPGLSPSELLGASAVGPAAASSTMRSPRGAAWLSLLRSKLGRRVSVSGESRETRNMRAPSLALGYIDAPARSVPRSSTIDSVTSFWQHKPKPKPSEALPQVFALVEAATETDSEKPKLQNTGLSAGLVARVVTSSGTEGSPRSPYLGRDVMEPPGAVGGAPGATSARAAPGPCRFPDLEQETVPGVEAAAAATAGTVAVGPTRGPGVPQGAEHPEDRQVGRFSLRRLSGGRSSLDGAAEGARLAGRGLKALWATAGTRAAKNGPGEGGAHSHAEDSVRSAEVPEAGRWTSAGARGLEDGAPWGAGRVWASQEAAAELPVPASLDEGSACQPGRRDGRRSLDAARGMQWGRQTPGAVAEESSLWEVISPKKLRMFRRRSLEAPSAAAQPPAALPTPSMTPGRGSLVAEARALWGLVSPGRRKPLASLRGSAPGMPPVTGDAGDADYTYSTRTAVIGSRAEATFAKENGATGLTKFPLCQVPSVGAQEFDHQQPGQGQHLVGMYPQGYAFVPTARPRKVGVAGWL